MITRETEKAEAARRSIEYVQNGMVVGLGTGTTAKYVLEFLGERVRDGLKIRGIPTSRATGELAASLNIPLTTLEEVEFIDVTIDGADEVAPGLSLIKGGGGALLHEKIVATSSKFMVIVADQHKVVDQLGAFPLPVEVIPFAEAPVRRRLEKLGANPTLRRKQDGKPFTTDEGNLIFDCGYGRISDPPGIAQAIKNITGVVEHGLFLGIASVAIIAGESGIQVLKP